MSWGVVVGAGAAIYGANRAGKAAKDAQKSADKQAQLAADASKEQLDFAKQQYNDWKAIFGDVAKNLSSYYEGLSPKTQTVRGLEAFEEEKNRALTTIREQFAQRGLGDSGLAMEAEMDFAQFSASE